MKTMNKINYLMNNNNILYYGNVIFVIFLTKILIIINKINTNIFDNYQFQNSKIALKIKGISENSLLGNIKDYEFKSINYLKEVNINGFRQDTIAYKYIFTQADNYVELIWDDNVQNCDYMLYGCNNITEINLSQFNTSNVASMNYMFLIVIH